MVVDYGLLSDSAYVMVPLVLALLYLTNATRAKKERGLQALAIGIAALAATFALVTALKIMFPEARPAFEAMDSFPSRHAAIAFAAAALGHMIHLKRERIIQAGLYVWAGVIAAARVLGGFHWPHDVVVGGAIGLAVAAATMWAVKRYW